MQKASSPPGTDPRAVEARLADGERVPQRLAEQAEFGSGKLPCPLRCQEAQLCGVSIGHNQ
jgi:hypothetical protein